MAILKQSTAFTRTFMMIATSDHISGLTGATVTVKLSKAGGSGAAAGGTVTEVDSTNCPGLYKIALTTTDTNTLGDLAFCCTATSADPTNFIDQVCANILGDTLPSNVTQWNGTNVATPATAGIPDVNVKNINNTAAATPGTSGGMLIAGSNAATSVNITGNITGNLSGSVGSVTGAVGSVTGAVGSVTGNVGGNVVGSVASVTGAVGSVTAAVTVGTNNDKTGYALSSTGNTAAADALLNRDMSAVSDTNTRTPLNSFRFLRNKWTVSAGTLTVFKEDGTTTAWTGSVTTDGTAQPITGDSPS